jgi:glycosyltransferase involved in cell wall biosynthesis
VIIPPPKVSIITATFNRAAVLRYTIESVLAQTVRNWEMIIVGDACTDETAQMVADVGDSRVRFVDLEQHSGEQATPNNEGVRISRGEFVAFLNHDDLWRRDHLSTCLDAIVEADMVFSLLLFVRAHGSVDVMGDSRLGTYTPAVSVPASAWLVRREALSRVGPWKPARQIFGPPSQDWLHRAHKQGLRMRSIPRATVIKLGWRDGAYANRDESMHPEYGAMLRESDALVEQLLTRAVIELRQDHSEALVFRPLREAVRNVVRRLAMAIGVHPLSVAMIIRFGKRGGHLDDLRRRRGLGPLPRKGVA